jgi:hypothetical protein
VQNPPPALFVSEVMEFGTKNLKTGAKLLLKLRLEESLKVDEEFQYLFLVALRIVSEAKGELAL